MHIHDGKIYVYTTEVEPVLEFELQRNGVAAGLSVGNPYLEAVDVKTSEVLFNRAMTTVSLESSIYQFTLLDSDTENAGVFKMRVGFNHPGGRPEFWPLNPEEKLQLIVQDF